MNFTSYRTTRASKLVSILDPALQISIGAQSWGRSWPENPIAIVHSKNRLDHPGGNANVCCTVESGSVCELELDLARLGDHLLKQNAKFSSFETEPAICGKTRQSWRTISTDGCSTKVRETWQLIRSRRDCGPATERPGMVETVNRIHGRFEEWLGGRIRTPISRVKV